MNKFILLTGFLISSWVQAEQYSIAPLLPERQVVVRSEVAGIVDDWHYENGDTVKKDDGLLAISARDYDLNLDLAKFELDISKSELQTQQKQLERYQSLHKSKGISASDLDNQMRLTNISRAQRNVNKVKYEIAKETLNKSKPKSPFGGVIFDRSVELGQFISVGDPLYTVADTRHLKARFYLLESDFARLKKGDQLKVEIPSTQDSFIGEISLLSPSIQSNAPGFLVEVTIDNANGKLSAGMESRVYLNDEELE